MVVAGGCGTNVVVNHELSPNMNKLAESGRCTSNCQDARGEQYNDMLIKCCDAQGTCDTCNNDMVNVNRCCCRSKMDAQKDSSRCIDEEKQVSRYCTTPQASSGSNGIVTGELDSG